MQKKVENDAAAYIRSFVAQRGRNVELAEKGVLESLSFTEEEAREGNLIDGIAQDLNDILTKFDGREIQRFDGQKQVLKLQNERLKAIEMTARQKVLSKVLNPNIALILGLIGLLGLYIEFSNPGLIFPGVVGGVCVFLALVAFNILPINLSGSGADPGGHRSFRSGGESDQLRTSGFSRNRRHDPRFSDPHQLAAPRVAGAVDHGRGDHPPLRRHHHLSHAAGHSGPPQTSR